MSAELTAAGVATGRVIDVGGLAMRVSASDAARAAAVAGTLRPARATTRPVDVDVRFEDAAPPAVRWPIDEPLQAVRPAPDLTFVRGDYGLVAMVSPSEIVVSGEAPDLLGAFRRLFGVAVAHCLGWHARHVVHAAAVVADGGCVLVFGATGTGKSTTALCALRQGWAVLADDLVALRLRDGRVLASGIPRPIAAPGDLVQDDPTSLLTGDWRDRRELAAESLAAGEHTVRGLIMSAHGDAPTGTLHDVPTFEVLRVVASSFLTVADASSLRAVFPVATALSRLPATELAHGCDPSRRLDDGAQLLDQFFRWT